MRTARSSPGREDAFSAVGGALERTRFKEAIGFAVELAREAKQVRGRSRQPWFTIKDGRARAATTLYVALRVIDNLKTLFYPFLPFSSNALHSYLGYEEDLLGTFEIKTFEESTRSHRALVLHCRHAAQGWAPSTLAPGQKLREPRALFKKLDEKVAEAEKSKLGKKES